MTYAVYLLSLIALGFLAGYWIGRLLTDVPDVVVLVLCLASGLIITRGGLWIWKRRVL